MAGRWPSPCGPSPAILRSEIPEHQAPEGRPELSPALQRWGQRQPRFKSRRDGPNLAQRFSTGDSGKNDSSPGGTEPWRHPQPSAISRQFPALSRPIQVVILSAAGTSQSEVSAQSKDPCIFSISQGVSGILPVNWRRGCPTHRVLCDEWA